MGGSTRWYKRQRGTSSVPRRRSSAAFTIPDAAVWNQPDGLFLIEPDRPYKAGSRKWQKRLLHRLARRQPLEVEE